MRKVFKYFKPFDYIFIILAIAISFIPPAITRANYGNQEAIAENVAIVKIAGQIVDEFPLTEDGENIQKVYYPNDGQYNIVEVDGTRVRIKEDNSPDQIGVNTGWIERPGQVAICLPHGFLIEVKGQVAEDELILPL